MKRVYLLIYAKILNKTTHTHTYRKWVIAILMKVLSLAFFCYFVNSTRGRSQAETRLSGLHKDHFTRFSIIMLVVYLLLSKLSLTVDLLSSLAWSRETPGLLIGYSGRRRVMRF